MHFSKPTTAGGPGHPGHQNSSRGRLPARGRVLAVLVALVASLVPAVVSATPAQAAIPICVPYALSTQYGAVQACTQNLNEDFARVGLHSPHTNGYSWKTDFLPLAGDSLVSRQTGSDTRYHFYGGRPVATAYGAASWGVQVFYGDGRANPPVMGRFAWWNFNTRSILKDSEWLSIVR
jgi:hypothetical protein